MDRAVETEVAALTEQVERLCRGTERVVSPAELRTKIVAAAAEGRPLRIKLGLDPTAPDIHLGHTVVLRKLRDFQDLGHEVHLVIGDFTGRIGDPSGKSETRRQLTGPEVAANAATYVRQLHKILDPERTRVRFNSEWLAPLQFAEVVALASRATVAQMLERDDFAGRFRDRRAIHLHEFFYALMQGYDSVALRADVEIGGTDQTFNLMMAREIQRDYGQAPEAVVITPLLVGTDGVAKMSKSLNNYIGIDEPPQEMFGKVMSLPDHLIREYFLTCTRVPAEEVEQMGRDIVAGSLHPRDAKLQLGAAIVTLYHGAEAGARARQQFLQVFSQGGLPDDLPERPLPPDWGSTPVDLLVALQLSTSRGEAKRLVQQGAVEIDGRRLTDPAAPVAAVAGAVVRAGKRAFCRIGA